MVGFITSPCFLLPLYLNSLLVGIVNKKIFLAGNACVHNRGRMSRHGYAIARFSHRPCPNEWRKRKRRVPLFLFLSFFILFGAGRFTFPFHVHPLQKDYVERNVPFTIGLRLKGNLFVLFRKVPNDFFYPNH